MSCNWWTSRCWLVSCALAVSPARVFMLSEVIQLCGANPLTKLLTRKEKTCSYFLKCLFRLSAPVENGTHSSESSWSLENLSSSAEMQSLQDFSVYPTCNKPLCLNHFKADMQTAVTIPLYMTVHLTGVHRWAFLSVPLRLTSSLWLQLCVVWYRIRARCVVLYLHGTELKHGSVMRCFHLHLLLTVRFVLCFRGIEL